MAYRLLTKGSIEEKIRALQRVKSALVADVLGEDSFARSLTLEDLQFLFSDEPLQSVPDARQQAAPAAERRIVGPIEAPQDARLQPRAVV